MSWSWGSVNLWSACTRTSINQSESYSCIAEVLFGVWDWGFGTGGLGLAGLEGFILGLWGFLPLR
jgi:hypothetical protein